MSTFHKAAVSRVAAFDPFLPLAYAYFQALAELSAVD